MESQPIRVAIYPIPDLAEDKLAGLKQFIIEEFKKKSGKLIEVETDVDQYELDESGELAIAKLANYLTDDERAYDVMELDTEPLEKLVKTGCLQALENHFTVTEDVFTPYSVRSVTVCRDTDGNAHTDKHLYGVPTLVCAKFVMELEDVNHPPQKPLKDWASFDELKDSLGQAEGSGHSLLLKSDFDSSGKLRNSTVAESQLIVMYTYSEHMGVVLRRAAEENKPKKTRRIAFLPVDDSNKLLTYTDALVVNKSKFADKKRAAVIMEFVKFYTSLEFRTSFAFGKDLPNSVPRYVLPARKDFYTSETAVQDDYYQQFYDILLQHSVPAPNDDLRSKGKAIQEQLKKYKE